MGILSPTCHHGMCMSPRRRMILLVEYSVMWPGWKQCMDHEGIHATNRLSPPAVVGSAHRHWEAMYISHHITLIFSVKCFYSMITVTLMISRTTQKNNKNVRTHFKKKTHQLWIFSFRLLLPSYHFNSLSSALHITDNGEKKEICSHFLGLSVHQLNKLLRGSPADTHITLQTYAKWIQGFRQYWKSDLDWFSHIFLPRGTAIAEVGAEMEIQARRVGVGSEQRLKTQVKPCSQNPK